MTVTVKNLGNGIKNIKINDPKTYNSLSFATLSLLIKTFQKMDKDNSTRVIILEGVGKGLLARILSRILGYENVNENANILTISITCIYY